MNLGIAILAALLLQAPIPRAGPPAPAEGSSASASESQGEISGRFVCAQTGEPLKGVSVEILAEVHGHPFQQGILSAADGSFSFQHLPAGNYQIRAQKSGYRPVAGSPTSFPLEPGQIRRGLEIKLNRAAIITGRVTDAEGEPVVRASVSAYRFVWRAGRRSLAPADSVATDDRGLFRFYRLPAGRYIIGVRFPAEDQAAGEGDLRLAETFYPNGSSASEAVVLETRWGQELSEINMVLRRQRTFSISGRVFDSESGGPCRGCAVSVGRAGDQIPPMHFGVAADGGYRARGLTPGTYFITAFKTTAGRHVAVESRQVQITSEDLRDVYVAVGPGRSVTGRVVFDPPDTVIENARMSVALPPESEPELRSSFRVLPDFSFQADGLSAGMHRVQLDGIPNNGYIKAVRLSGRDLPAPELEIPGDGSVSRFEIVIGFDSATLAGQVKLPDPSGEHRITAAVIALFPQDAQASPFLAERRGFTQPGGAFTIPGIPPGSYTVYAFPASGNFEWEDPGVRRAAESYGKSVDLRPGQKQTIDLPLAPEIMAP